MIAKPTAGGDILTEVGLRDFAAAEQAALSLVATDDEGKEIVYSDVCVTMGGPACFFPSLLGPNTPWNLNGSATPTAAVQNLLDQAAQLEAARPVGSTATGIHLAMTQLYTTSRADMFLSGSLGKVTWAADGNIASMSQ